MDNSIDVWASTQHLEQLPPKMQADRLMVTWGPAVIKTFLSFKLITEEKADPPVSRQ
jgi:hypothetical protein